MARLLGGGGALEGPVLTIAAGCGRRKAVTGFGFGTARRVLKLPRSTMVAQGEYGQWEPRPWLGNGQ